jgi:hypothetical protein
MGDFTIRSEDIPLWTGAKGVVHIRGANDLTAPPMPGARPLVAVTFDVEGANTIGLGASDSISIGIEGGETASIGFLWKSHPEAALDLITELDLAGELDDARPLIVLQLGTNARLDAQASFHYNVLNVGTTLTSGVDASFAQVRVADPGKAVAASVRELLATLTLPARISQPLGPGERVRFEFSGELNVGVSASAGYDIKGTKGLGISQLKLSEHYQLAIVGKLAVAAKMSGRYAVEVRPSDRQGWARVIVRRARSKDLLFAADATVDAEVDTRGLPASGKEFLGALLGVQVKNWLNLVDSVVDQAGKLSSPAALEARLDTLSSAFIERWTGVAVDRLLGPEGKEVLAKIEKVVDSYRRLDDHAIALFDRFYDPLKQSVGDLTKHLGDLQAMSSWDQLKGEIDPLLWNVLRQLTDGDPLGWALGLIPGTSRDSLDELKKRIADAFAVIQTDAHAEIRTFIAVAKEQFGLDGLMSEVDRIDSVEKLKALASTKVGGFVSRLTGTTITKVLGSKEAKAAFEIVRQVKGARDGFWKQFDEILAEAAKQSFALKLRAAYAAADERDALIDIDIRLLNDDGSASTAGQLLMRAAGRGDFSKVLAAYQPDVVRLREGVLTHKATRQSTMKVNIAGWHLDYAYESAYRVITDSRQQIRTSPTGHLTVFTQIDMRAESDERHRRRHEERMQSSFLLRFLGETSRSLTDSALDPGDRAYMVDVITGVVAAYDLTFTDESTTRDELADYLSFAKTLGLDKAGVSEAALAPLLEFKDGSFGRLDGRYEVRFTTNGLASLFPPGPAPGKSISEAEIRQLLRRIVVGTYCGTGAADVGWLFCSDRVCELYEKHGANFIDAESILAEAMEAGEVRISSPIAGIVVPRRIANSAFVREALATLLRIQRDLVRAFTSLQDLVKRPVTLRDFERGLSAFGSALNYFDEYDHGSHSVFSVCDGLIQLRAATGGTRSSSLTLTATREGQPRTVVFALPAAESPALAAGVP